MTEWIDYTSRAIAGFPMGDPPTRSFPIYLPPDYHRSQKKYPVVFFLAGYSGKGSGYLADDSAFGLPLQARFDNAIDANRLSPFIGVFPDCTSRLGHSQYVNSPAFGNYLDYLTDELPQVVDTRFRTIASASHRVVAGHSSGGFGALVAGMKRPDVFNWVIASASDSFYEFCHFSGVNAALIEIHKAGSLQAFLDTALSRPARHGGREFQALMTLAMAPCYAPNVSAPPLYGDLFFDLETGEIIPEVWAKFLAWDPIRMIDSHKNGLKKLQFIQLECGLQDEHGLQWGHRQIAKGLRRLNVPHELVEYPGGHSGHHWRFEERLARLFARFPAL
jgi:enterochelin esterase-like enzyme